MKHFWLDALERAIKTAAQTAIAAIGTASVFGDIDWMVVLSTVGVAAILSILSSIASAKISGEPNSASLVNGKGE